MLLYQGHLLHFLRKFANFIDIYHKTNLYQYLFTVARHGNILTHSLVRVEVPMINMQSQHV